jgi:biotin transporter BioY
MHLVLKKPDAVSLAVKTGALIFLPGDIIKCLILTLIVPKLRLQRHQPGVV